MSKLAASNPTTPVSPDLIQLHLGHCFPTFRTPFHPPYFFMIEQAIKKLNDKGGSSEGAISRFIEKEYEGLPWAHASFLSHHLKKLCISGEILCVNGERYMLPVKDGDIRDVEEEEEVSHGSNIANRDGKEDQTLVQASGRETEEYKHQLEKERQSVEVNGQRRECEQRILRFEEETEGKQDSVGEVREESQNLSGQVKVVEEINEAKAKLAEEGQEQRGIKRKQPEMNEQQIKVVHPIPV